MPTMSEFAKQHQTTEETAVIEAAIQVVKAKENGKYDYFLEGLDVLETAVTELRKAGGA